ncbi:MAG: hypothetical protein R2824_14535 [Saprospiraceae bacterium]|nr:hypothetical protein [Lewinella sp.]
MNSSVFNVLRIRLLLWSDLRLHWRRNVIMLAGLLVFSSLCYYVLVFDSSMAANNMPYLQGQWVVYAKFHVYFFPVVLLAGGFIFTSISFGELNSSNSRSFYLSLPATALEKVTGKWLLTALLFPLSWLLLYQIFAWITYNSFQIQGYKMVKLSLIDPWLWLWIGIYILTQTIFFLGAVTMPKYSLIKTGLVLGAGILLLMGIYDLIMDHLIPLFSEEAKRMATFESHSFSGTSFRFGEHQAAMIDHLPALFIAGFGLFIAPFLLYISLLKLKEKEV